MPYWASLRYGEVRMRVGPSEEYPVEWVYKRKGLPVKGAAQGDLEFYANGCQRSLDDPAKARWHEKERVLLDAIEAELKRQGHTSDGVDVPNDAPPPDDMPF